MVHVKKLVMHGFKSFANKTEIPFDNGINVVIGPNGSGKSNITDALCFVLGRISAKSMRAAKSSNLLFHGNRDKKHSNEASVGIVFDNSDKGLSVDANEVAIERVIKKKGSSVYRINNEVRTRQEVLELLAQSGIDPNGFNLVLQGEIAHLIKMRGEERREIIEEVAGISIYETRKQKSLKEIEKTEQKLKEVSAVLRERTAYLKNLEQERKQALRFKELENTVKQCKATLLKKQMDEKTKSVEGIEKNIQKDSSYRDKLKEEVAITNKEIEKHDERTNEINQYIHKTTGFERESLNDEITELNVRIASDKARQENFEKRLADNEIRKTELMSNVAELEKEIENLRKESPKISKRQQALKEKKSELEKIEVQREEIYTAKTELTSIKERVKEKNKLLEKTIGDSKELYNQISILSEDLSSQSIQDAEGVISEVNTKISELDKQIADLNENKIELGNNISIVDSKIEHHSNLKNSIPNDEICPVCQTKLTEDHRKHVTKNADEKIEKLANDKKAIEKNMEDISKKLSELNDSLETYKDEISRHQEELLTLRNIEDKKNLMKRFVDQEKQLKAEIEKLEEKQKTLANNLENRESVEDKYNKLFFEMQELSSRTDENLDTTILYRERELESMKNVIKGIDKDENEIKEEISGITQQLEEDESSLDEKEAALEKLSEEFQKLFDERTKIQETIKQKNTLLVNKQNALSRLDEAINNLKVEIARISAERESLEYEIKEFGEVKLIQGSTAFLQEKLKKSEQTLISIGNVNMRALETYDAIKEEYDKIATRVEQLENERDDILAIIKEIDVKKKRTFMKTFKSINELFTRNFSQLSSKGTAFLEIENKEDIFAGGLNIMVKVAKGKYMDLNSMSGGEKTLIALSLIFAIQEYNPYAFYILDEIDAALDKRNSELLANLLKKYIKTGQYIIISHNDSIISGADNLYGVSMNNGISKILSLDLKEAPKTPQAATPGK